LPRARATLARKRKKTMGDGQSLQHAGGPTEAPRVSAFLERTAGLLVPGERLEAWAVQRRLFALVTRRMFVVATTGRLLVFVRGLVAGYEMRDVRWQDVSSARIRVGIFGADLRIGFLDGGDLASEERPNRSVVVAGLRKTQAQEVYRLCQAHDQAWREKRRIRDLEELRARSGGLQIGTGLPLGASPALAAASETPTERLKTAKDMLLKGLISDAEYEAIKAKIVAAI
jgi:hypothetical protein